MNPANCSPDVGESSRTITAPMEAPRPNRATKLSNFRIGIFSKSGYALPKIIPTYLMESYMSKQAVQTEQAPGAIGPYSQGIIANDMVFTAGQTGVIPATRKMI